MKLYIHGYSSFLSDGTQDIKKILKDKYKVETRRQDAFIHLALYGAELLKEQTQISKEDELYITSGVGDIDVIHKTNTYMYKQNQPLQLFDFINLLGNTTNYYVAKSLGIKGKSIFQISDNFTYYYTLMSAYASIYNSRNDVIIGSVDLVSAPQNIIKRIWGVDESIKVQSSVNFQKFSLKKEGAIASVEFGSSNTDKSVDCKNGAIYFETKMSYMLNQTVKERSDRILHEKNGDNIKSLKVEMI